MRAVTQSDLLALWESGRALHPLDWSLLAVNTMLPEIQPDSVADWPIGRRNRALVEMQLACFGPALRGWTSCPRCADKLEFALDGLALAESPLPNQGEPIVVNGRTFRLPTSRDLARVAAEDDPSTAAVALIEMCRISEEVAPVERRFPTEIDWTKEDLDAIGDKMALADPLGEIMLHFDCPECGESFDDSLDLPTFLRAEIEGRAKRLLREVHTLASAYGWGEAEILSLNPARRQFYLEMVLA
jgi:hypothetical protein